MNAQIIPFHTPKPSPARQVSLEDTYFADEFPELFDADEDLGELETYVQIADTWDD